MIFIHRAIYRVNYTDAVSWRIILWIHALCTKILEKIGIGSPVYSVICLKSIVHYSMESCPEKEDNFLSMLYISFLLSLEEKFIKSF